MLDSIIQKGAEPLRWLMIAGIAWTMASAVLFFVAGNNPAPLIGTAPEENNGTPDVTPPAAKPVNVNAVLNRHLFGQADATPQPVQNQPTVETRLPLELNAVFVDEEDAGASTAIIAQKGRGGELYRINANVPGGASLAEVHPDHVVLNRAGIRERLAFPAPGAGTFVVDHTPDEPDYAAEQAALDAAYAEEYGQDAVTPQSDQLDAEASLGDMLNAYKEQLQDDPDAALDALGVEPVADGASQGYRLGEIAQSAALSRTGLQPGDVILSINGRPIGDVRQDQQEFENILAQGNARLEIKRGDRRFFITAPLNTN